MAIYSQGKPWKPPSKHTTESLQSKSVSELREILSSSTNLTIKKGTKKSSLIKAILMAQDKK